MTKKKTIKAWIVWGVRQNDVSDQVFATRKAAREYLLLKSYHSNPEIMKIHMESVKKNYKVIPCTINFNINKE